MPDKRFTPQHHIGPGTGAIRRPQDTAASLPPFGGGMSQHPTSGSSPVDLRGKADWYLIWQHQVSEYIWGQLIVSVDARPPAGVSNVHAEIRVIGYTGGSSFVMAEDAVANYLDLEEELSTGPMRVVIEEGHMPDRLEVYGRARRGGAAETVVVDDETLLAMINVRLHNSPQR